MERVSENPLCVEKGDAAVILCKVGVYLTNWVRANDKMLTVDNYEEIIEILSVNPMLSVGIIPIYVTNYRHNTYTKNRIYL